MFKEIIYMMDGAGQCTTFTTLADSANWRAPFYGDTLLSRRNTHHIYSKCISNPGDARSSLTNTPAQLHKGGPLAALITGTFFIGCRDVMSEERREVKGWRWLMPRLMTTCSPSFNIPHCITLLHPALRRLSLFIYSLFTLLSPPSSLALCISC